MNNHLLKRVEKLEEKANPKKEIRLVYMWTPEIKSGETIKPKWKNDDERIAFIQDWRKQQPDNYFAIVNNAIVRNWRKTEEVAS